MVYCKLKNRGKDFAVYIFGDSPNKMPGEVVFYQDLREPVIQKTANCKNELIMIARIYGKHKDNFEKGIFKEKLSHEIG